MPSATVWVKADGGQKYKAIARRLRKAGRGDLQRKLTKAVREEGQPALAAVRAAWMTVDVESTKGGTAPPDRATGLRRRVARATRIRALQSGISIAVNANSVDARYPSLVYYLNGFPRTRSWRHPVFGNRLVWTAQKGQEVFYPTLREFAPAWRAGIYRAMEETAAEIES
jgi:hypothetical protein